MKKLIIFDLDGTLVNTIADLADSTNHALQVCGFPLHDVQEYKFFVGNGINKLFERALPEGFKTEENILKVRKKFLIHYDEHNTNKSTPYPDIPQLLSELQKQGKKLAVASNKYHSATEKLVAYYFPNINFTAVLGQRENIPVKPAPEIIFDIMKTAETEAEEVLYVGDSGVDMQTARNAKVTSVGVTWGFRPKTELEVFSPDYIINEPKSLLKLI